MRRRTLLLSLLVLAATAMSALAMTGSAGAERVQPRIICPQIIPCCPLPPGAQPDRADATPCCPQSGSTTCCTTGTCCTSGTCCVPGPCCTATCPTGGLTIAAAPNPSTAGRKVVISGALTASPAGGVQVALWRERAGQSSFSQIATTTTDSAGDYKFTRGAGTVMADQAWYVTSGALRSATITQRVRAVVGLAASTHTTVAGAAIVLRGHVTPSHAGEVVLLEQRHGGVWRVIARPRLSKGSSYSVSHRFAQSGKRQLRAVLLLDTRNIASSSRVLALTIKP
jgi:hypothetical protein